MARLRKATLFALFALFCGPLVGSAGAASGIAPVVASGAQTQIGTQVSATPSVLTDTAAWEDCPGGIPSNAILVQGDPGATVSYTLALSDAGTDVCAVELTLGSPVGSSDPIGPIDGLPAGAGPTLRADSGPIVAGQSLNQTQTLSVSPGAWGAAQSITDVWEDCDPTGELCSPVSTGSSYPLSRSDVGSTIEVFETATAANQAHSSDVAPLTGLVHATAPTTTSPQGVSGTAEVGQPLKASPVGWSNQPTAYTYQWDRCSGGTCAAISGATDSTYSPVAADVGDTLLVYVAGEIDPGTSYGSAGSPYPSYPTSTVIQSPVVPVTNPHIRAVGRLTATMRWTFRYAPTYTQITALAVQGPALGSTIATRCTGKGCPFPVRRIKVRGLKRCRGKAKCRAPRQVNLEGEFRGRNLAVGTKVTVMITRPRDIGKYYGFVVRRRRAPAVKISCLAPGSRIPGKHCTGV